MNTAALCNLYTHHITVLLYHTAIMGSTVLKFLSLVSICIMIIDGALSHEEGKRPTTSEYMFILQCSCMPYFLFNQTLCQVATVVPVLIVRI